jgi:acyl carrier protein
MLEKIAEIICEYVYIDPAEITEQANLRTDIGLSSLDLMSVASDMENTFGVKISERAILTAKTVGDLIACVG